MGLHYPASAHSSDPDSDSDDASIRDRSSQDKIQKIRKILYYTAKKFPGKWEENKDTLHRILINYLRSKPKQK